MALHHIDPSKDEAERVVADMRLTVETFADDHGAALAGFAIVTWDLNGAVKSAFSAPRGAVGAGMVPALAMTALTIHRSVQCASPEHLEPVGA